MPESLLNTLSVASCQPSECVPRLRLLRSAFWYAPFVTGRTTTGIRESTEDSSMTTVTLKAALIGVGLLASTTLSVTEAAALAFSFKLAPGESRTCQLFHGYYKVGTKYERWSNYKVAESKSGTTTVPFQWGPRCPETRPSGRPGGGTTPDRSVRSDLEVLTARPETDRQRPRRRAPAIRSRRG